MRDTHKHIAGLGILFFQPRLQQIGQRGIARFVALHQLMTVFVYRNQMIVFVDDFHTFRFLGFHTDHRADVMWSSDMSRHLVSDP